MYVICKIHLHFKITQMKNLYENVLILQTDAVVQSKFIDTEMSSQCQVTRAQWARAKFLLLFINNAYSAFINNMALCSFF